MLSKDNILAALALISEQDGITDLVSAGRISGISIRQGHVGFILTLAAPEAHHSAALEAACERALLQLPGVSGVTIVTTASAAPTRAAPARKSDWQMHRPDHVRRVIAVASGKGGVGKSTTAVNLAHAFAAQGKRVGLLDADIYGPSLPRMMGVHVRPESRDGLIVPVTAHGITCLSMGLMVDESAAIVWRGPQVSRALFQMLRGAAWGTVDTPLDVLVIDTPPGTGDVHLSLAQMTPLDGAVIVTTPQDIAVADARKAIDMFRKVYVKVSGIVENMSGFTDPAGVTHAIFGEGGGEKLAQECHTQLLGQVPINMHLRAASDTGEKFGDVSGIYRDIAEKLFL